MNCPNCKEYFGIDRECRNCGYDLMICDCDNEDKLCRFCKQCFSCCGCDYLDDKEITSSNIWHSYIGRIKNEL